MENAKVIVIGDTTDIINGLLEYMGQQDRMKLPPKEAYAEASKCIKRLMDKDLADGKKHFHVIDADMKDFPSEWKDYECIDALSGKILQNPFS